MPIAPSTFFGTNSEEVAQGDIFKDVPFVRLGDSFFVLRKPGEDNPLSFHDIAGADLEIIPESVVDSFSPGVEELCVVPVVRTLGMLMTPTCELAGDDFWLFAPLRSLVSNPDVKPNVLFGDAPYVNLFGIYDHPKGIFEQSFVAFNDAVPVLSDPFRDPRQMRVANLGREAQDYLAEKFGEYFGRSWGFNDKEKVEPTGYYRCRRCSNYYGLQDAVVEVSKGNNPPTCPACKSIRKAAQWQVLLPHKKSKQPFVTAKATGPNWWEHTLGLVFRKKQ